MPSYRVGQRTCRLVRNVPSVPEPTVSVVIPVYRSERFIAMTLASVQAQRGVQYEIIVVDDGSPDGSHAILQPLAEAGIITYLRQSNRGMAAARNTGLAKASGEFVAFLDHDDRWPEDKLAWQAAYLREHPDVVLVGGRSQWVDESGKVLGMYGAAVGDLSRATLFASNHLAGPGGTLMRTADIRAVEGFDENLFGADDWDLYLRLLTRGRIVQIDRVALYSGQHAGQASRDLPRMAEAARTALWQNLARLSPKERRILMPEVARAYRRTYGWVYKTRCRVLLREGHYLDALRLFASLWRWREIVPCGLEQLRPPAQ